MQQDLFGEDTTKNKTVSIPFKAYWKQHLLSGSKTCTTRTARYGKVGDTFRAFGAEFVITDLKYTTLQDVRDNYYTKEGCSTPFVFETAWCSIHPAARFKPELKVWLHFFERTNLSCK